MLSDRLPKLLTYEQAKAHYNQVKPYSKGANEGLRPLGANRRYHRSIISLFDEDTSYERVVLSLYNNRVVTRHASGVTRVSHCGWRTQSTLGFLRDTTEGLHGVRFMRKSDVFYCIDRNGDTHRMGTGGVTIDANGVVHGAEPKQKVILLRDKYREVVKPYKPFVDYCKQMTSVCDEYELEATFAVPQDADPVPTPVTTGYATGDPYYTMRNSLNAFMRFVRNATTEPNEAKRLELYYSAFVALLRTIETISYRNSMRVVQATPRTIVDKFYDCVKHYHGSHIFQQILVHGGPIPSSANVKYVGNL